MTSLASHPDTPAKAPPSHTILLVDDEVEHVRALAAILRSHYRVLSATSAASALDILQREPVCVILSDQRMPDMTGVEFLAKSRQIQPDAVRLLCTGFTDAKDAIDAINQGHVFRYLTKPVAPDALAAALRESCERFDLFAERRNLLTQLQQQNDQLRQANSLKTNFIRVASHELRTPLTILLGLTQLTAGLSDLPSPARDRLDRMKSAAQRLQYLVDQLISMLASGQFEAQLDRRPTDLWLLLRQAAEDVRPFIDLRHQTLHLDLPSNPITLPLDAYKIRDSLNHLLLNAIKFTPDRGTVTLSAEATPTQILIHVSDTGVGMSDEHLRHLFTPFFTGHDVSRHSSGLYEFNRQGLGLGLSVVKAFVELHGGTISVRSTPSHGSTFTLTLPTS